MAVFIKDLSKLSQPMKHDEMLNIEYHSVDWQPQPVMEINNNYCYLKSTMTTVRNLFLIPWLCAFIVLCGMYTNDFVDGWNKSEWSAINYINNRKEDNGDEYFATTTNEMHLSAFQRISEDGVMTLKQYIHDRYHYYVAGERKFHTDIFILIIAFIAIPGLLYWVITFPRYAPLIFDRKRRLVYSWRKGVIAVARYDELHIYESSTALMFVLRSETKNNTVGWFKFAVQPSGNLIALNHHSPHCALSWCSS
jgi:hypothetical protein